MFNKILVPLDGSREAEVVFPYLQEIAPRFSSQVDILAVGIGNKRRRVNQLLKEYIDKAVANLNNNAVEAKAVFLYGNPADEILAYAQQNIVDLIIMATHGRGGITRWWMGSIAEKVISETISPVLLIHSKYAEKTRAAKKPWFTKILAPLDGSDIGEVALPYAEALAIETGASLSLLQVIEPPRILEANITGPAGKDIVKSMHDASENYLCRVAKRLNAKGIKNTLETVTGDPAYKIVECAEDDKTSLIAMSTHGRSGIARWVLGSVADKVLHETKIPMWLVRSPKMVHPTSTE